MTQQIVEEVDFEQLNSIVPSRVLHVVSIMDRAGAETLIMNWYRQLDRTKIQFDFVENDTGKAAYDEEIENLGGRIFRCPRFRGYNLIQYLWWWYQFFQKHSHEYIAVHGHISSTATMYLTIAKSYGIFTIAHSHYTDGRVTLKRFLSKVLEYPTRYIADYFFGCSNQAISDRYGRKIFADKGKSRFIPNVIDVSKYAYNGSTRNEYRKNLHLQTDDFVVGHVGRFDEVKNHKFLLQIFAEILKKQQNAKLLLVGDGTLHQQIVEQAYDLGIFDKIIMTGVRDDVYNWYQVMDVFVFPSLREGLPVTLVEAQSSGLSCVIADTIPSDCDITNLVERMSLQDSAEAWAEVILSKVGLPRKTMQNEVMDAGFDSYEAIKWLENFYLGVANDRIDSRVL